MATWRTVHAFWTRDESDEISSVKGGAIVQGHQAEHVVAHRYSWLTHEIYRLCCSFPMDFCFWGQASKQQKLNRLIICTF